MRIEFYLKQRIQQNLILEVVSWRSLSRTRVGKYSGTLVVISHDSYFVKKLVLTTQINLML